MNRDHSATYIMNFSTCAYAIGIHLVLVVAMVGAGVRCSLAGFKVETDSVIGALRV